MKTIISKLVLFTFILGLISCEKVIDLELNTGEPTLVVEGNIDFNPEKTIDTVSVKLTMTTGYYEKEIPKVNNATVWIEDGKGNRYTLIEVDQTGEYISTEVKKDFVNNKYILHIEHNNQVYEAVEELITTPEIIKIEQSKINIMGKDLYQIKSYFQDTPIEGKRLNYYFNYFQHKALNPEIRVQSNEFSKGNVIDVTFLDIDEKYQVGDTVTLDFHQISRNYYDFLHMLSASISNGGGPFQAPIAQIKGNVKNLTTPGKDAKGYFRITEIRTISHTIYEE